MFENRIQASGSAAGGANAFNSRQKAGSLVPTSFGLGSFLADQGVQGPADGRGRGPDRAPLHSRSLNLTSWDPVVHAPRPAEAAPELLGCPRRISGLAVAPAWHQQPFCRQDEAGEQGEGAPASGRSSAVEDKSGDCRAGGGAGRAREQARSSLACLPLALAARVPSSLASFSIARHLAFHFMPSFAAPTNPR